jgi:hypothetical protein
LEPAGLSLDKMRGRMPGGVGGICGAWRGRPIDPSEHASQLHSTQRRVIPAAVTRRPLGHKG